MRCRQIDEISTTVCLGRQLPLSPRFTQILTNRQLAANFRPSWAANEQQVHLVSGHYSLAS